MSNETSSTHHPASSNDATSGASALSNGTEGLQASDATVPPTSPAADEPLTLGKMSSARQRFRALWSQKRSRTLLCILGAGVGIGLSAGTYAWFQLGEGEEVVNAVKEPTNQERFDQQFTQLSKPEEVIARLDAFKITDDMLRKLTTLPKLTTVQVDAESVSASTLEALATMPALEQLHLRGAKIDDDGLRQLGKSKTIWLLNLTECDVSPEAIESLAQMPELRQLRLGIKHGDNRHGRAVATLSRLRAIHLIGVAVTDEGLRPLAQMPQLESLYLDETAVTESGWTWLFQENPQLHVHVNQKHHDRDPQKH
jgi:hypothetical protein